MWKFHPSRNHIIPNGAISRVTQEVEQHTFFEPRNTHSSLCKKRSGKNQKILRISASSSTVSLYPNEASNSLIPETQTTSTSRKDNKMFEVFKFFKQIRHFKQLFDLHKNPTDFRHVFVQGCHPLPPTNSASSAVSATL